MPSASVFLRPDARVLQALLAAKQRAIDVLSGKMLRLEGGILSRPRALPATSARPSAVSLLPVSGGNVSVARFMFVFTGPDFSPGILEHVAKRIDSGQLSDRINYCIVSLHRSVRVEQLPGIMEQCNSSGSAITLVPTVSVTGEPFSLLIPVVPGTPAHSSPIWLKCEHDRKHKHPAARVWTNQSFGAVRRQPPSRTSLASELRDD